MPNFVKAANISDLKPGENKTVSVNGTEVALFNVDGQFFAISNTCLHRGGPLGEGMLDGDVVTCPWHGWRFNVKTGVSPVMPNAKVAAYKIKTEGNDILIAVD
ncbi:Rieske 2Fe-2S domain-containing protein [Candidatus Woesearchaeota archaeon]|nr:Rieske 2Fe-2S domain-containing protein [Candidatus Woesearchaeota archaeon]